MNVITAIARASVQPISWRNPCVGMSLSTKSATRKPRIACVEAVKSAIAAGNTYIDTAAIYKNEKSVGEGIKENSLAKMLIS